MKKEQPRDEIIAGVRAIRDELAARHRYDLDLLYEEAKRREGSSDRVIMEAAPKRLASAPTS